MRRWDVPSPLTGEAAPQSLVRRLQAELDGVGEPGPEAAADSYLDAAASLFQRLMLEGCGTRDRALDLLAVDALVTYALEAGADDPARFEERAGEAMRRFAALAGSTG